MKLWQRLGQEQPVIQLTINEAEELLGAMITCLDHQEYDRDPYSGSAVSDNGIMWWHRLFNQFFGPWLQSEISVYKKTIRG